MLRPVLLLVSCLAVIVLAAMPGRIAQAQSRDGIHRCVAADGSALFTDRSCEELQATERLPPPTSAGATGNVHVAVRSCARTREDLADGVRSALDAQDVNRLAGYYHWTGMGTTEAYRLMDRLDSLSRHQIIDVQMVISGDAGNDTTAPPPPAVEPTSAELSLGIDTPPPAPPAPRVPDLIRVDQMRGSNDAGAQTTYFRMHANAGCWWIRY
ncbi:MAG TPA: hypothetical protein VKM35_13205 [Arenimonas sp.]|uniref:hypothetical protein n=1 Tax=Arenimonas sp. TaxID=1872635 RepID=UPI002CBB91F7|nr:hypothetical protein [Arenimonas sp.]HMB58151.1 hypothetical protein [Arenimonas sp.]